MFWGGWRPRASGPLASGKKFDISGQVTTNIDGTIYWPGAEVTYSGSTGNTNTCGAKIIAKTVKFSGSTNTTNTQNSCANSNVVIGGSPVIGLVE